MNEKKHLYVLWTNDNKVTAEKMYQKGIFTGKDLKTKSAEYLEEHLKYNHGKVEPREVKATVTHFWQWDVNFSSYLSRGQSFREN